MGTTKITKSASSTKTTKTVASKMARAAKAKLAKTGKPANDLKAELKPTCDKLRHLFAGAAQSDSLGRYEIGALVRDVKTNTAYGKRGVLSLAEDLAIDASVMYAHAVVATVWTLTEFKKLASRVTTKKNALSFSHWIEMAQVEDEHRNGLIERAFAEGLSVCALKDVVAARKGKTRHPQVISNLVITPAAHAAQQTRWTKSLDAIRGMAATVDLVAQLDAAIVRNDEVRSGWEANGQALNEVRACVAAELEAQGVGEPNDRDATISPKRGLARAESSCEVVFGSTAAA